MTIYNQETFLALHIMQLAFYCYFLTKPIFLKAYFKIRYNNDVTNLLNVASEISELKQRLDLGSAKLSRSNL